MAGIFRANNPFNTFLLLVYGIFLKICWFIHPHALTTGPMDGFLYKKFFPHIVLLQSQYPIFYDSIVYLFLFTQAVIFNRIVVNQRLMQKANYYPAMSYLLLTSLFASWNEFSSVLIVNTLLIWAFAKINKLYNTNEPKVTLFNIGMIIGLISFLFMPALGFLLFLILALIVSRPFRFREWVVALIGIITPYYLLCCQIFLSNGNLGAFKFPYLKPFLPVIHLNKIEWALLCLSFLVLGIGVYFVYTNLRKQVVQVRKNWTFILFYFLISCLLTFFYSGKILEYSLLILVPLSAYFASFFFYPRFRIILIIVHWVFVSFIIYSGFINS